MPSGVCQVRSRPFTSLEARACQSAGVGFLSLISKISVRGGRGPSNLSAHVTPDLIRGPPSLACLPNGRWMQDQVRHDEWLQCASFGVSINSTRRSEEHTSELQSLMRISYAVFCLKK